MTNHISSPQSDATAIGWALYDSADLSGAAAAFERAITNHPEDVEALRGLGRIRLASNDLALATILLERALTLISDGAPAAAEAHRDIQRDLAWAYFRLGRYDLAAPLFATLPGQEPIARLLAAFGDRPGYRLPVGFQGGVVPLAAVDPIPFVEVEVGSGSYLFVVDTGAGDVILDRGLARDLALDSFGQREVTLSSGQLGTIDYARLPRLKVGDVEVHDLPVEVADIRRAAPQIYGFIGTNLLARFCPTFDFAGAQLRLAPRDQVFEPPPTAQAVDFWLFEDHVILARGGIGVHETLLAIANGIAGTALVVPEGTVRQAGLVDVLRPEEGFTAVGGGGSHTVVPFTAPSVNLGEVRQHNVEGLVGPFFPNLEWRFGFRVGGVIAHEFMRHYRWTIDWARMRLWFEENSP